MIKTRHVVAVVASVGFVAFAVSLAHAGAGGGSSLPPGTTTCRQVLQIGNPKQVINLTDQVSNQNMQVNPPAFLCDLDVTATVVKGPVLTNVPAPNAVMCYQVAGGGSDQKVPVTIVDSFGTHDVKVGGFKFVCVPAQVEE